jgi:glycine/D-amino acid oxidase-like deaminating enzyme
MQKLKRVVVVGAGVMGLSVAWRLAAHGADVTVVEAGDIGCGTSATSFAWVNASSKADFIPTYFVLNALALEEHHAIKAMGSDWFSATGDVEIAQTEQDAFRLLQKVRRLKDLGYAAEMLTIEALEALEPGTKLKPEGAAAFYREEGWADVRKMVDGLAGLARGVGAVIVKNDAVLEVLQANGAVSGVRLASGAQLDAEKVVIAVGRWTAGFLAGLGVDIPLVSPDHQGSAAIGLLARVVLKGSTPHRVLHSSAINWSPLANGRALLASDAGDRAVAADRSANRAKSAAQDLIDQASRLNPLFENATVEAPQIGVRALPKDGLAICGWVPGLRSLYVMATHSGVTLAPLLGNLAASEILESRSEPLLANFRPDRFLQTAA